MNKCIGINVTSLQGFYKVGVVNPETDEVKWQTDEWQKNLILNIGMNSLYNRSLVDSIAYGVSGTGTRPNSYESGTSKITQSGAIVHLSDTSGDITNFTSSNDYSSIVQTGDMVVDSDGSRSLVTTVTNGFNLQVVPSYTYTVGRTFTLWKTSQTSLHIEVSRSATYIGGASNAGTTTVGNNVTHLRSYDFPIETSNTNYNELGLAWASSGASTTFSRILLPSVVTANTGYKLRLIYQLQSSWFPTSSINSVASIGGWGGDTSGTQSLQKLLISSINVSDGTAYNTVAVTEPYFTSVGSGYFSMFASTNSASLASFGSAINRSVSPASYVVGLLAGASKAGFKNPVTDLTVSGAYYCDRTSVSPGSVSVNAIRSIGFGVTGLGGTGAVNSTYQAHCFVFNQPQALLNTQTLSLTFRTSWTRILG